MSHDHVPMENPSNAMRVDHGGGKYTNVPISAPPNSRKAKEETRSIEPVPAKAELKPLTDKAVVRNKPVGRRLLDSFRGEDLRSVGGYLVMDILVPSMKDLILDLIQQGAARAIKGESYSNTRGMTNSIMGGSPYVPYNRYSQNQQAKPGPNKPAQSRPSQPNANDFQDILLPDRGTAEYVLSQLNAYVQTYDFVTVRELFELVGIQAAFTADYVGWNDLSNAGIRRVGGGGYILVLPPTISLK